MTDSTTPAQPEVAYSTTQDAAQALLARWNSKAETPTGDDSEPEAQDADEQDAPAAEQADEATADAADESEAQSEADIELDLAGEKLHLPANLKPQAETIQRKVKELEAGSTRKFQEAAEIRKQADADRERVEIIAQVSAARLEIDAEIKSVEAQINAYDQMDWNALSAADPQEHGKHLAIARGLDRRLAILQSKRNEATQRFAQAYEKDWADRVSRTREYASSSIKGWSESVDNELLAYVGKRQLAQQDTRALAGSPSLYEMAYKAMRYDQLQEARPAEKKAVQVTKTLRPGTAAAPSTSAKQRYDEAKKRAFKSGSTEDVAAALFARSKFRK